MSKSANLNIRVDPEVKASAEALFASFGITLTDAVNIFLHKSLMEGGLPFAVRQPRFNPETLAAMKEARAIMNGELPARAYASYQDFVAEIDGEIKAEEGS